MTVSSSSNPAAALDELLIGGIVPFSTVDYPGRLAAVVFLRGCPWRCRYCQNTHLQSRRHELGEPTWARLNALLRQRQGLLDAVVFSGGEPLVEKQMPLLIETVKAMGFSIGLHTGGSYPERLAAVLPWIDWVGLDIKAWFDDYASVTQVEGSGGPARESLELLLASGVEFECRTTIHPVLHTEDHIRRLAGELARRGVKNFALQVFRETGCNDPELVKLPVADYPSPALLDQLAAQFEHFELRRGG